MLTRCSKDADQLFNLATAVNLELESLVSVGSNILLIGAVLQCFKKSCVNTALMVQLIHQVIIVTDKLPGIIIFW